MQSLPGVGVVFVLYQHHACIEKYCSSLEQQLNPPTLESIVDTAQSTTRCRKCQSTRVFVTTKQLRRADEGATEIRSCQECGYTTRLNS